MTSPHAQILQERRWWERTNRALQWCREHRASTRWTDSGEVVVEWIHGDPPRIVVVRGAGLVEAVERAMEVER